ncbi:MAG: hypothetical protein RQ732_03740 [Methylophaga sp.]|nr:hypothetical protein [Methylophaga sp.]
MPDIDDLVYINNATHLTVGDIVQVKFKDADEQNIWAHPV